MYWKNDRINCGKCWYPTQLYPYTAVFASLQHHRAVSFRRYTGGAISDHKMTNLTKTKTSDGQQLSKCTYMYCHPLTLPLIEWDAFIQMIVIQLTYVGQSFLPSLATAPIRIHLCHLFSHVANGAVLRERPALEHLINASGGLVGQL